MFRSTCLVLAHSSAEGPSLSVPGPTGCFSWNISTMNESSWRVRSTFLAILCDLFGMVKWPFQRLNDLQLGDKKVTLNHLVLELFQLFVKKNTWHMWPWQEQGPEADAVSEERKRTAFFCAKHEGMVLVMSDEQPDPRMFQAFPYGGFLEWWYPTSTIGFPTKNDHFGVWIGGTTI